MTKLGIGIAINCNGIASGSAGPTRTQPTLTFSPTTSFTYAVNTTFALSVTTNSPGTVKYTSSDPSVISISGSTATIMGAGSATVMASIDGTSVYLPANSVATITVAKANPTLSLSVSNQTVGTSPLTLNATTNSDSLVSYTSSNTSVVSISGNTATILAVGTTTITASVAATRNFNAATTSGNMDVSNPSAQTWSPYFTASVGNDVWYLGNIYRCLAANTGANPTNTYYWKLLAAGSLVFDTDANNWFTAVTTAGSSVSSANQKSINTFFASLKHGGVWNAIKQSHLLVGPTSLAGALVPISGVTPTNNAFVSTDYAYLTGLSGNRNTKYLDLVRLNNADANQANRHMYVYASTQPTTSNPTFLLGSGNTLGDSRIYYTGTGTVQLSLSSSYVMINVTAGAVGVGMNHNGATSVIPFYNGNQTVVSGSIPTQSNTNFGLFATGVGSGKTDATIAFYSIGDSADLTVIDTSVKNLLAALV